jgi:hypothetical protein
MDKKIRIFGVALLLSIFGIGCSERNDIWREWQEKNEKWHKEDHERMFKMREELHERRLQDELRRMKEEEKRL